MAYTPPSSDSADFVLQGHNPPAPDAADFDLTERIRARPANLDADDALPSVTVQGTAGIAPGAATVTISDPEAGVTGVGTATIGAGVATVRLTAPDAGLFYSISPPPADLDLSVPAFDADTDTWEIDNFAFDPTTTRTLTPRTLSIGVTVGRDAIDHWRQYDRAGDVRIATGYAGAFSAIDRAGRASSATVEPAPAEAPPFDEAEFYVNSYEEQQVAADRYEVSLTLHRVEPRSGVFAAPAESGGDYELATSHGTLALESEQVAPVDGTGASTGGERSLAFRLGDAQAGALADALGRPDAIVERAVPDGADQLVDETGGDQTVTLSTPAAASVPSGEYLVRGWTIEWASHSAYRWRAELTVAETG